MQYHIVNNSFDKLKWFNYVSNHPNGNFFQTPSFIEIITGIPGYSPINLFLTDSNSSLKGLLCGVIQKEGIFVKAKLSSRLIIWGGPIVDNDEPELTDLLLNEIIRLYKKKVIYIEIRNLFYAFDKIESFKNAGFRYNPHLNYIVQLDEVELVKKRISESKLRQIKSSFKNGIVVEQVTSFDDLKKFYSGLTDLYRKKIKKPLVDFTLFEKFLNNKLYGIILTIKLHNDILGGILCPIYKDRTIYEWYIYGLDLYGKGIYPSVIATWAPIEYGLKNGIGQFDFMGAGSPESEYGVREFKSKFGGQEVEYGRYLRINNRILYSIGKLGIYILGKIGSF